MIDDTEIPPADQPVPPTKRGGGRKPSPKRGSSDEAKRRLAELQVVVEEVKLEERLETIDADDWFVRCKSCNGPAVFLTRHPQSGLIGTDMWYSAYRSLEDRYITNVINCQSCGARIPAVFPRGERERWRINVRHIQSFKDMERRQKIADAQRQEYQNMKVAKLTVMDREMPGA